MSKSTVISISLNFRQTIKLGWSYYEVSQLLKTIDNDHDHQSPSYGVMYSLHVGHVWQIKLFIVWW